MILKFEEYILKESQDNEIDLVTTIKTSLSGNVKIESNKIHPKDEMEFSINIDDNLSSSSNFRANTLTYNDLIIDGLDLNDIDGLINFVNGELSNKEFTEQNDNENSEEYTLSLNDILAKNNDMDISIRLDLSFLFGEFVSVEGMLTINDTNYSLPVTKLETVKFDSKQNKTKLYPNGKIDIKKLFNF